MHYLTTDAACLLEAFATAHAYGVSLVLRVEELEAKITTVREIATAIVTSAQEKFHGD